ncbi:MAG: NADPH-dependent FMN reductase [Pseudomonadota bacterium]
MVSILGLSGSLRRASYNCGLLRAARTLAPKDVELVIGSISDVPLYNADLEAEQGSPPAVKTLCDQLKQADGLLLATPEYNNGIPGVFKNAIDWMASGPSAKLFFDKPVAVIGASPMSFGTVLAQDAWWPVLRTLKTRPWFEGRLMIGGAGHLFDEDGTLTDDKAKAQLKDFVTRFAATI